MLKVRVKEVYFDKVRDEYPEVGKEFDVEEKRADVLVKAGVCEFVEEGVNVEGSTNSAEKKEEKPVTEPKKATKKAKAETK